MGALVAQGRELKEQPPGFLRWVIIDTVKTIFFNQSTLLWMSSAWGESIALPAGITLPHTMELKSGCWVRLEAIPLISLTSKTDFWVFCETSADSPQGLVLVKSSLDAQLSSLCTQTGLTVGDTRYGLLIVPNRLTRASTSSCWQKPTPKSFQVYLIHRNKYKEAAKMRRQWNRPPEKEEVTHPEELDEMKSSNSSDRELE